MTSELWNDLHGFDKVQAILVARQAREAKKCHNPNARLKGESTERHEQRLQFQKQREYVRAMRANPFMIDIDLDE